MMMIGFMTGIWMAMRRAIKVRADADVILNIGFIALIFGVVGARAFFVAHYWEQSFANQANPLMAALNISAGGLEFYGGFVTALVAGLLYLLLTRRSVRWYLDILTPSLMWGLAWGRLGCFLNGCCWGGLCLHPQLPWAVTFPYGSGAFNQHVEQARITLPAELQTTGRAGQIIPLPAKALEVTTEQLNRLERERLDAAAEFGQDHIRARKAKSRVDQYRPAAEAARDYGATVEELARTARSMRSLPVHPAQVYGIINALMISAILSMIFYRRRRHGAVFGWMMLIYPVSRIILELIRTDNPLDTVGLTISQAVSLGVLASAAVWFVVIYTLPMRSPRAVPVPVEPANKPARK
jgi:phosphatidylglycerol:prolipoprotein diacylglycerol transferase